jgi:CRISPR-associated protein Csb2
MVAASAALWKGPEFDITAVPALQWLAGLAPPRIRAGSFQPGIPVRIAVPNNDLDVVAADWVRGREPRKQPSELKTLKTVRTSRLLPTNVTYCWNIGEEVGAEALEKIKTLQTAARSIVQLGWGVDLVAAQMDFLDTIEPDSSSDSEGGHEWCPVQESGGGMKRVPNSETLQCLLKRHDAFLNRLRGNGLTNVPPLPDYAYHVVTYRRDSDAIAPTFAAFELRLPDGDTLRPFDAPRQAVSVAGMVRHALALAAERAGWSTEEINVIIHGHTPDGSAPSRIPTGTPRFAYFPLPSIQIRSTARDQGRPYIGMLRRIVIACPVELSNRTAWLSNALAGAQLFPEGSAKSVAVLSPIPNRDWTVQRYTDSSSAWTSVTPVVLPGFDDRSSAKTDRLIRKAFLQAGLPGELVRYSDLDWRQTGFLPGVDLAGRYRRPSKLDRAPCVHVKVEWKDASGALVQVPGPLAAGSGRFRGLGIFVAI